MDKSNKLIGNKTDLQANNISSFNDNNIQILNLLDSVELDDLGQMINVANAPEIREFLNNASISNNFQGNAARQILDLLNKIEIQQSNMLSCSDEFKENLREYEFYKNESKQLHLKLQDIKSQHIDVCNKLTSLKNSYISLDQGLKQKINDYKLLEEKLSKKITLNNKLYLELEVSKEDNIKNKQRIKQEIFMRNLSVASSTLIGLTIGFVKIGGVSGVKSLIAFKQNPLSESTPKNSIIEESKITLSDQPLITINNEVLSPIVNTTWSLFSNLIKILIYKV